MKKILMMLAFALHLVPLFAFDFSFGGRIGASYTIPLGAYYLKDQLNTALALDPQAKNGLGWLGFKGNFGLYADFGIVPQFSIQPEISFGLNNAFSGWNKFGATAVNPDDNGLRQDIYEAFDSIDLLLLFKGRFQVAENIRVTVGAGPSVIIPLGYYRSSIKSVGPNENTLDQQYVAESLSGPLIGITFDVGGEFDFGNAGYLSLSFRSDWSLTPVHPKQVNVVGSPDHNAGYWHRPAGITLGYGYRFYDSASDQS